MGTNTDSAQAGSQIERNIVRVILLRVSPSLVGCFKQDVFEITDLDDILDDGIEDILDEYMDDFSIEGADENRA